MQTGNVHGIVVGKASSFHLLDFLDCKDRAEKVKEWKKERSTFEQRDNEADFKAILNDLANHLHEDDVKIADSTAIESTKKDTEADPLEINSEGELRSKKKKGDYETAKQRNKEFMQVAGKPKKTKDFLNKGIKI